LSRLSGRKTLWRACRVIIFLDVYNNGAGTIEDVIERKNTIVKNKFNPSKTYPNF
jgi:hypothetical protein